MFSARKLTALSLACGAALWLGSAHAGPAGVMGGGLRELVNAWEVGDPRLPTHLALHLRSAAGEPLVHVQLDPGTTLAQMLPKLQAAGFRITAASVIDPSRLEGYLPLQRARGAATLDGVKLMKAVQKPRRNAGSVQSQAVAVQKADIAQAAGANGAGIRLAALSDSFDACPSCTTHAADDVASGDLPAGVYVQSDITDGSGSDEGRAMLQLAHDVAPGAVLGFATAFNGEVDFANQILALRFGGFRADVIVDDVVYLDEPMFSDGLLAQAVDIVARNGAAYFSSAGNNGIEAYQAVYDPVSYDAARGLVARGAGNIKLEQIPAEIRPRSIHRFAGNNDDTVLVQRFTSAADNIISFQWDEPFYLGKVKTDYNLYVFDAAGNWMDPASPDFPGFCTTDDNTQTDVALEILELLPFPNEVHGGANVSDYQIVIGKVNDGPARRIKYVNVNGLGVSAGQNGPSVFGHAAARGGQAVAAMYYAIPNFPEDFSSPGPVTIYLDANGKRLDEPQVRAVPQITAADGVDNTFFGFDPDGTGKPNFFGTSAAAPNAAAVAALALQAAGGPGSVKPAKLYKLLQDTATRIPTPNDRSRAGAQSGPIAFTAQADWTRWADYFGLAMKGEGKRSVASVTFDLSPTDLVWSMNATRFHVGDHEGIQPSDVSMVLAPGQKVMTLNFTPGAFTGGDSFRFGMSAFNPLQGSTQMDPDRFRGMPVTTKLDNGAISIGIVQADPKQPVNRFAGAGLVNAAAAVREAQRRSASLIEE
jgi:hypothetical protein